MTAAVSDCLCHCCWLQHSLAKVDQQQLQKLRGNIGRWPVLLSVHCIHAQTSCQSTLTDVRKHAQTKQPLVLIVDSPQVHGVMDGTD